MHFQTGVIKLCGVCVKILSSVVSVFVKVVSVICQNCVCAYQSFRNDPKSLAENFASFHLAKISKICINCFDMSCQNNQNITQIALINQLISQQK